MSEVVPFGRYKGMPVEDMLADQGYMAWLECQPWFRAKFAHIIKNRDVDAASRTPVHNRLQTLFLEDDYCIAFALTIKNNKLEGHINKRQRSLYLCEKRISFLKDKYESDVNASNCSKGLILEEIEQFNRSFDKINNSNYAVDISRNFEFLRDFRNTNPYKRCSCDVLLQIMQKFYFLTYMDEYDNKKEDAFIKDGSASISNIIESFFSIEIKPTVADEYPAVLRQMSRNNSEYLFVGEYTGEGATQDQFVKIFKESGKTVVFKKDVDAKLEELRRTPHARR